MCIRDRLVALGYLMAGKGGTTARAVGNDLEALVQQALLPDLLQRPPLGLDVVVIVCDKRMLHVSPEAYGAGEILPHALVFPDALFTFADERIQAVLLDLLLAVQTQHLLDLQLYRKSVGIPAGLSWYLSLIHILINNDASINGKLKVVFIEDYRVSNAELIFAAADVSCLLYTSRCV